MIRKSLFFFGLNMLCLTYSPAYGQKMEKNILKSTDIQQIEKYLVDAHPDDPKRGILKRKLIFLKNEAWTRGAKNAVPMAARPLVNTEEDYTLEENEFRNLMATVRVQHDERTVKLLNNLFNNDSNKSEVIVVVRNRSECDIIVRIEGSKKYNIAVPARQENVAIVEKGVYSLKSRICGRLYSSQKNIEKGVIIDLGLLTKPSTEKVSSE